MITPSHTAGKTYAVLGLGKSGVASALALQAAGATVLAWDDMAASRAAAEAIGITLHDLHKADWRNITALVMSPGIPHTYPSPHPVAAMAKTAGVTLTSDIQLLFDSQPQATFIGITGTNGKSTTTALIAHILQAAGKNVAVGGNLGTPVLSFPPLGTGGIYVLELSSYQLELIQTNPLAVAVLLNITPDHLDRHGGMAGYIAAKRRIVRQDGKQVFVCGVDDPDSLVLAKEAAALPHIIVQRISQRTDADVTTHDWQLVAAGVSVLPLAEVPRLPGLHNAQNMAAAYAACLALGLERETITSAIRTFPGLAHRQQWVGQTGKVQFINDSKATNADATSKALACYDTIYWILGGKPKEGGLSGLEEYMPRIRHAFLIGQAAEAFADWLARHSVAYTHCGTLDKAVQAATAMATQDGMTATVLLSPACASFDQFKNFEERGEQFSTLAKAALSPAFKAENQ